MPFKKFKKKFVKKSFRKKRFTRKSSRMSRGELMINRSDPRKHTVIADRYSTQMFTELLFELNSSVLPASQYFDVAGNYLFTPFDVGSGTVVSTLTGYSLIGGTTTAVLLCPNGYGDLASLYNNYIVRASRITVNLTPSNQTTALAYAVRMCVFPWGDYNGVGVAPPTTIEAAQVMPYAKNITCTVTNNIKMNTISNYVVHHKLLGCTRQQFEDNPSCQIPITIAPQSAAPQDSFVNWRVIYQVYATGTTVYTLDFSVNVKYYAEWMTPSLTYGIVA